MTRNIGQPEPDVESDDAAAETARQGRRMWLTMPAALLIPLGLGIAFVRWEPGAVMVLVGVAWPLGSNLIR